MILVLNTEQELVNFLYLSMLLENPEVEIYNVFNTQPIHIKKK